MFHLQFARTVSHYRFDHQNIEFRRICRSFDQGGMRKEGFEPPRVMAFKFGFRKAELPNAKVKYFNPVTSTFTLPAFTTKSEQERVVDLVPDGEIFKMLVALTEGRAPDTALLIRNGKPVRDFRTEWRLRTADITGGSGKGGTVTLHDLRRSAITGMSEKGVTAAQAGTHLTQDVFSRYITRDLNERRSTAMLIEGD